MKTALLLLAFFGTVAFPDSPATQANPDYPVHVQVLRTKANEDKYGAHGFGRGNILGPPLKGIDFTYYCATPFLNNGPTEFYQARWKKPEQKLELLMQRIGSNHLDKCEIDISYKPMPYSLPSK
jgi:hypothetical protein